MFLIISDSNHECGTAKAADRLVGSLRPLERSRLLVALARRIDGSARHENEFADADLNKDGVLSRDEWLAFKAAQDAAARAPVRAAQLVKHAARGAGSMVGFGFSDNFVMLTTGELIEAQLGPRFGCYGLAAAAMGNLVADVVGCLTSSTVERATAQVLPDPRLTPQQEATKAAQVADTVGQVVGISTGCVLGCAPLLFGVGTTAAEMSGSRVEPGGTLGAARATRRAVRLAKLRVPPSGGAGKLLAPGVARGRAALAALATAWPNAKQRRILMCSLPHTRAPTFGANVLLVASVATATRRLAREREKRRRIERAEQ